MLMEGPAKITECSPLGDLSCEQLMTTDRELSRALKKKDSC